MAAQWTLTDLKEALLTHPEVTGWSLVQERTHRRERYFLAESSGALAVDQDRNADSLSLFATLYVAVGRDQRQGEISKKLFPALPLGPQLNSAIAAGQQTDHRSWSLPSVPANDFAGGDAADPLILADIEACLDTLTEQINAAVGVDRGAKFNSAELFISIHHREQHWSTGLVSHSVQSRIYVEAAYSAERVLANGTRMSDEYLHTQWAVAMADLSVEQLFAETAERAIQMLDVEKPDAGTYPVIVHADVLAQLFADQVSQLTGANAYNKLPFIAPGEELVADATGDLLTITLDPELNFGADTARFSRQGVPQRSLRLTDRNRVTATSADQQHASYLGFTAPTTVRGNIVVDAGTLSYRELQQAAPVVIEIVQFSGLFTDANSGTFSSEIRLARLHDNVNGTVRNIKGGSLSGAIKDNFKAIRLSNEVVKHAYFSAGSSAGQGYLGPRYALLSEVSIAG